MGSIKTRIKSSYWAAIAYYLVSDMIARVRFRIGDINTSSGTIHSTFSVQQSIAYVQEVFEDYRRYAGVDRFHGRVAEAGPGDNCGVALLFLDNGCDRVDLVDRFYSNRDAQSQAVIYRSLVALNPSLAERLQTAQMEDERTFPGLTRYYGNDAAAEQFFVSHAGYDRIVSRAVFEHLYDPVAALRAMASALNPGGHLLHKVDLRDHAMFSGFHHELKYLEVPDRLYPWMTQGTGRPNRVLVNTYRSALESIGLKGRLLVMRLAGVGALEPHCMYADIPVELRARSLSFVRAHRGRFARSFRAVSDEDLSVTGVFLIAHRGR